MAPARVLLARSGTLSFSGPNSCLQAQEPPGRRWAAQEASLYLTEFSGSRVPSGPAGFPPGLPGTPVATFFLRASRPQALESDFPKPLICSALSASRVTRAARG